MPHVNVELRRQYLADNPHDELADLLDGRHWWRIQQKWGLSTSFQKNQVHHIYRGAKGVRYDVLSLLLTVSSASHDFCHAYPREGLIACLVRKQSKQEFDADAVRELVGRDIVELAKHFEDLIDPHFEHLQTAL